LRESLNANCTLSLVACHEAHVSRHASHAIKTQDGSGDLDLGELNAVLASISGGAMSAGVGDVDADNLTAHTITTMELIHVLRSHLSNKVLQEMPGHF
jgi:hypothetical protein